MEDRLAIAAHVAAAFISGTPAPEGVLDEKESSEEDVVCAAIARISFKMADALMDTAVGQKATCDPVAVPAGFEFMGYDAKKLRAVVEFYRRMTGLAYGEVRVSQGVEKP